MYRENSYMLFISVNKKMDYSAPIFFVPLGVPYSAKSGVYPELVKGKGKPTQPKSTVKKTPIIQTKPVASKITPIVTPKKPTTVAAVIPKKTEEKKQPVIEQKKETPKKEDIKKVEPKIEPKKEVKPTPQATPIVEQPKTEPVKPANPESPVAQAIDIEQTIIPVIPENAQISHNYREVEALRRGAQLQKELVQKWKPPIGVSPDCMCEVSFFVNTAGTIEDLKMVKSSGVVMYDISARQALFAMKMPQWAHGKTFTIGFKQ
jgi:hypothetical protein